tara:strand:+ start:1302 stop:2000 length:699 start_codon:yes stop_codon:yes gene_type:complete
MNTRPAPDTDVNNYPYGKCPECGCAGQYRERRPNGNDECSAGHKYPSAKAITRPTPQVSEGLEEFIKMASFCDDKAHNKPETIKKLGICSCPKYIPEEAVRQYLTNKPQVSEGDSYEVRNVDGGCGVFRVAKPEHDVVAENKRLREALGKADNYFNASYPENLRIKANAAQWVEAALTTQEGFVSVPIEPTKAMKGACMGEFQIKTHRAVVDVPWVTCKEIYKAMIATQGEE